MIFAAFIAAFVAVSLQLQRSMDSRVSTAFAIATACATMLLSSTAAGQAVRTSPSDLTVTGGSVEMASYKGRNAIRLTTAPRTEQVFALLKGSDFRDGTIEADIAIHITTPPGVRMPGFVGLAFRSSEDTKHYDMFYLRPRNSHADDQAMRNHSVQYVSAPGNDWYKLRRQWPSVYESYSELETEGWNHVKIQVTGRIAKLFLNGSQNPSLIVDGLKGEKLRGGIALWGYDGEEAYFSNVHVTSADPAALADGTDPSGKWSVDFSTDYGKYSGTLSLSRTDNTIKGEWSGDLGKSLAVGGTWRNGYIELSYTGAWPEDNAASTVMLAGWFDGDAGKGRVKIECRADGQWSAVRAK